MPRDLYDSESRYKTGRRDDPSSLGHTCYDLYRTPSGDQARLKERTSGRLQVMDSKASEPTLPFVWPLPVDGAGPTCDDLRVPFVQVIADADSIAGIVSGIDTRGVDWIEELLRETELKALVILAVYAGCPTRSDDLSRLLALQGSRTPGVEFRVLPMVGGNGAPANCLAAVPSDGNSPVFFFGTTPNLAIARFDATQLNMAFRADPTLTDKWCHWFDITWAQATKLDELTARIPNLVPATGSAEAAARWREYCKSLTHEPTQSKQQGTHDPVDYNSESPTESSTRSEARDRAPSESIGIRRLGELEARVTQLIQEGKQVMINHDSVTKPIRVSAPPELFAQSKESWDGTVVQFQSFQISPFSKNELQLIEHYRTSSQTILEKLGLPLAGSLFWMPTKTISLYNREISLKENEVEMALNRLIGQHARTFLDGKREEIRDDIKRKYRQLDGHGDPPTEVLNKALDRLLIRIENALKPPLVARPIYSSTTIELYEGDSEDASWGQARRLVMALARFPRKALSRHDIPSGLTTPKSEILQAMNIANDAILKINKHDKEKARKESILDLRLLNVIADSNVTERDRCGACFMLIDGSSRESVYQFVRCNEFQD